MDGGGALRRALAALLAQEDAPPLEIVVPWDETVEDIPALETEFSGVRFLPLGRLATRRDPETPAGQHELYDQRRARGLAAVTGEIVGMLEDRGVPGPSWASRAAALHERLPHAAIGGAIRPGVDRLLSRAVCRCDFYRYEPPLESGPADGLSDVNVTYKRDALAAVRHAWERAYHEPVVHEALRRSGETLYLTPELEVLEVRESLRLGPVMRERIGWGRSYGELRSRSTGAGVRLVRALAAPLVPIVIAGRMGARAATSGGLGRYLAELPALLALLSAWSAGEAVGLVGRRR